MTNRFADYTSGQLARLSLPEGKNIPVGTLRLALDDLPAPVKLTLRVDLSLPDDSEPTARNHWNFWVYPSSSESLGGGVLSVASLGESVPAGRAEGSEAQPLITDTLDAHALDVLARGGDVLLLAAGRVRFGSDVVHRYLPVFWNTSWFKMRPPHTTGAYIQASHPVFADFPTDEWQNLNWWELVNGAQVMNLAEFPADYQPIVQPIDTWHVSRKLGMLIEARVLQGRLLMTTLDLTSDLARRPVARQLRLSILNYMQGDRFQPTLRLEPQVVSNLFERTAPPVSMFTNESPDELKPALK